MTTKTNSDRASQIRAIRLEYNLNRKSDCVAALQHAKDLGLGPDVYEAIEFRMGRATLSDDSQFGLGVKL